MANEWPQFVQFRNTFLTALSPSAVSMVCDMTTTLLRGVVPAAFVIFGLAVVGYAPFVAEDAHIVGRYALNLVDGMGLVYNEGERVSALTSPLHALFVGFLALFSADPVELYRILAPFFPMAGVVAALRILRPDPAEAAVICVFGLASPFMALWSVGGLETPMLVAMITVWAAILLRVYRRQILDRADCLALGALAGLAFVTRYDSILITLPPMLALATVFWRKPALWAGAALAAGIAGAWLIFAQLYYGDILPTSFYTKVLADRASNDFSIMTVVNFVLLSGAVFCLPLVSFNRAACHPFGRQLILGVLASVVAFLFFAMKNSGMHMMFGMRYFVPFLPAIAILLVAAMPRLPKAFPPVLLALQAVLALHVYSNSINPWVIDRLGPIGPVTFEYHTMTPADYGLFIDTLRQDAIDIRAHWAATGREGEEPVISMFTAGMGYWMREFRVVEALVRYRHDCQPPWEDVVAIPDYVQGINFVPGNGRLRMIFSDGAENLETISATQFYAGFPWEIDYAYRTNRGHYPFPAQLSGACLEPQTRMADESGSAP